VDSDTGFFGLVVGLSFFAATVISVVGTGLNVYARFHPKPSWTPFLNLFWWLTLSFAASAIAYLLYRHLAIDARNNDARLTTYMAALTMSPCIVAGLVSLFFKP
jgi:hypothetical protein